jgi:hypothetical protein
MSGADKFNSAWSSEAAGGGADGPPPAALDRYS